MTVRENSGYFGNLSKTRFLSYMNLEYEISLEYDCDCLQAYWEHSLNNLVDWINR